MSDSSARLPHSAVTEAVDARHWRVLLGTLRATFRCADFATAAAFVARVAQAADAANHHPDVLLRWGQVTVTTSSHDVAGLTQRDVDLAGTVSALADELGLTGDVPRSSALEVAVDALDIPAVRPFWKAVLGYQDQPGDDENGIVDPAGVGPAFWFQQMDVPRPQRNRLHLDVTVPHDEARARVDAAVAAGGRLVSDERAPAFWVLADPEGNEACVCTWQARPSS
ncbi:VOC family protein [Cellulomonas fimi]|uniref:Putative pterin-4-alpha-carbinolamine dehydratase n=1 Tax=Cellulomonas fimi (strain ATCC 484 / DSM 20113 / JCM 1341 / CCUG 24087 / LMG 16345 / NBRC 15513 / NCIMB 8980 / NCTC 7547 / NRS-133) TaxID=590998 RepID=F4H6U4_CELFA|nr:VOC family protein [Cellulomonas fimi]AEE46855.1 transcriptional coactivator/pterin dehydratase [Cellulomonas fimi ATCC 484]NNH06398.1 4a-hydroxytetrahydrobiopterin dehydratase [Cellulomonas fimi]VEH34376.1 Putative pterin-4-alpha-carbinolamine dehydratase [Cellulomonas fimi]